MQAATAAPLSPKTRSIPGGHTPYWDAAVVAKSRAAPSSKGDVSMKCKSCHEEVDRLSEAGFCCNGICSIMEQGYSLGLQDVKTHLAEQARLAQRMPSISVDANGEPRAEIQQLTVVNSKSAVRHEVAHSNRKDSSPRRWP
jgi:hypothetical protein